MPKIWFDHIGIACESNEKSEKFWRLLGFNVAGREENLQQGVKIRFMEGNNAPQPRLELLEPISRDSCRLQEACGPKSESCLVVRGCPWKQRSPFRIDFECPVRVLATIVAQFWGI